MPGGQPHGVVQGCERLPSLSVEDAVERPESPLPPAPHRDEAPRRPRTPSYQPFLQPRHSTRRGSRSGRPCIPESPFPSRPQTPDDFPGRSFTPDAFLEDGRPMSRASIASFRSVPPTAWGSAGPAWGMKVAPGYGTVPKGTSRPATFSNLVRPATAAAAPTTASRRRHKRAEMPHLVDFSSSECSNTRDVGLQAAPCILTRFFFETSQQEHNPSTGKTTPTVQHFDVVMQPDILGGIDMSNAAGQGNPSEVKEEIRDWLRRSHESVCLVTKVLPADTFVDYDNVKELEGASEGGRIWPALSFGAKDDSAKPPSEDELLSLSQYARIVARMEPRSADDSRQLIKLQRGILTAVVAMHDEMMALYKSKADANAAELEEYRQRLYDEIAAPALAKCQELQDKVAQAEADRLAMQQQALELDQLRKKFAEQEEDLANTRKRLHEKERALEAVEEDAAELAKARAAADFERQRLQKLVDESSAHNAEIQKERDSHRGAYMQLKFSYNITRKLLAASKNADELERLQALLAEYEAQIKYQQDEIELLKQRLANANARVKEQEAAMKGLEDKASAECEALQEEFEAERMHQELIRRILCGKLAMVAGSSAGELVPSVLPPNSTATIPVGLKPREWSTIAMLHKEAVVCVPQSMAELPQEEGVDHLKPGEERTVGSLMAQPDPADSALKLQAECLDGMDPSDYAWVKIPVGAAVQWRDNTQEAQALFVAGTIIEPLGPEGAVLGKVHAGTTVGLRRDALPLEFQLQKDAVLSVPQSHATPQADSEPDDDGNVVYSLQGGAAFTWPMGTDPSEREIAVPPGSVIILGPRRRELSKAKSGMAALKGLSFSKANCFWCRMRALGKGADEEEEEGEFIIPSAQDEGGPRPGGLVGFRETELDAQEDCGVFRVAISRTDGAKGAVEIEVTAQDGTANEVVDYQQPLNGRLRWEDGETEDKFVEIPIVDDDFEEDDETFYAIIENIVEGDVGIGKQRCCITIKDSGAPRREMEGGDLDPSQLPWEQRGYREMKIPKPWKKMLGKINVDDAKLMAADKCRRMILAMYASKREADKVQDKAGKKRSRLDDYSAEFIRNYLGSVGVGKKLSEFIARLKFEYRRKEDNVVCMFVCLVGLFDAEPPVAHNVVVKALQVTSNQCSGTGCNSGMFWSHLQKGKVIQMTRDEAHTLLHGMVTTKDQHGKEFHSPEVDLAECGAFLDSVCNEAEKKSGTPGVTLDRMLSFLVSTNTWLQKKAAGRATDAYQRSASKAGKLDYSKFKAELSTMLSWNEPTQKMIFQHAQELEGSGPSTPKEVSVANAVAATLQLTDIVCYSSVS